MELIRLTADYKMKPFDCGDTELNGFLLDDAKFYLKQKIANTFILEEESRVVAYISLLNDKISKQEVEKATWRKVKKAFPHEKHFNSYPAIKIGRFAVSQYYKGQGIGSELMSYLKDVLLGQNGYSAFRFLTVDAYLEAIPFYERNDFKLLIADEENEHTRTMYFDMMQIP